LLDRVVDPCLQLRRLRWTCSRNRRIRLDVWRTGTQASGSPTHGVTMSRRPRR
jgi:hypothetical protein